MSANQSQHRPANRLRQRAPPGDDHCVNMSQKDRWKSLILIFGQGKAPHKRGNEAESKAFILRHFPP